MFCNVILFKIHLIFSRRIESEVRRGVFCSNDSTFVADYLARCLCCVSLANQCAFGASIDVGTLARPTKNGLNGVPVHFLSWRSKAGRLPIKTLSLVLSPAPQIGISLARVREEPKHDPLRCGMFIYPRACGRVK